MEMMLNLLSLKLVGKRYNTNKEVTMRSKCSNCEHVEEDHDPFSGLCDNCNCDCEGFEETEYDPDDIDDDE